MNAVPVTGVNFVSGYNATTSGGTVNTIGMATAVAVRRGNRRRRRPRRRHARRSTGATLAIDKIEAVDGVLTVRDRRLGGSRLDSDPRDADSHGTDTFYDNADSPTAFTIQSMAQQRHGHDHDLHRPRRERKLAGARRQVAAA